MYKRLIDIIVDLSEQKIKTINELAGRYHVSIPSIRNDINAINDLLDDCNMDRVSVKKGQIICPDNFTDLKRHINTRISNTSLYFYHFSREETSICVLLILLCTDSYTTIDTISEILGISRSTLFERLPLIKKSAEDLQLEFYSQSNKGIILHNSLYEKRLALARLLKESANTNEFLLNLIVKSEILTTTDYRRPVSYVLCQLQFESEINIPGNAFQALTYYLHFITNFIANDYLIDTTPQQLEEETRYLTYAEKIAHMISTHCNVPYLPSETFSLASVLSEFISFSFSEHSVRDSIQFQLLTNLLICNISRELSVNLNSDYQLFESLFNHLLSISDSEYQAEPDPHLRQDIEASHPEVIHAVNDNVYLIEKLFRRTLYPSEILDITVHFCAAIERFRLNKYIYEAIVVYDSKLSTSQLMKTRLATLNSLKILNMISYPEIALLTESSADLLISAIPIHNSPLRFVNITSNVSDRDLIKVSKKLTEMRNAGIIPVTPRLRNSELEDIYSAIKPVICEYVEEKQEEVLDRIIIALRNHQKNKSPSYLPSYLYQILTPEFIELDLICDNWQEAIKKSAATLLKKEYIGWNYVQEIIDNTYKYGAYYITQPGIALLHATPGYDCYRQGLCLIRLLHPVIFGDFNQLPVSCIVMMATTDLKSEMEYVFKLLHLLQSPDFFKKFCQASSSAEAYKLLYEYEKKMHL